MSAKLGPSFQMDVFERIVQQVGMNKRLGGSRSRNEMVRPKVANVLRRGIMVFCCERIRKVVREHIS
jgi:hypothetical protein